MNSRQMKIFANFLIKDVTAYSMDQDAIYNRNLEIFLLWASRETEIIDELLQGAKTSDVIAERTDVTKRAASIVLDALADYGYVTVDGDEYKATEELDGFDPEAGVFEKGILPHRLDSLENYMELPQTMRTGDPPEPDEEKFRNFVGAMATIDDMTVRAGVTAAEHVHPRPERVLDVGGGPGRFSEEFSRRGADVTLLDREDVIDLVRPYLEDKNVKLCVGDARESLPNGFDLIFSARMTVSMTPEELYDYFNNVLGALDSGGTFVCMDHVRGRAEVAERFSVHMLTMAPSGRTKTAEQYRSCLDETGFVNSEVREIPGTDFQAIIGENPQ
ncbi:MAG: class I SAM-dependent methyltransferase [Halobacteriaceae archaeon]